MVHGSSRVHGSSNHGSEYAADDVSMATSLLEAGVSRLRVKGLLGGHLKDSYVDEIAESVIAQKRQTGRGVSGADMPEIKQLVQEAEAPTDCLDPLFMHLMKDPVVLSSGQVMDRSSVHDENGELRFKHCPISRTELENSVYPLLEKKKKIQEFRQKRDDAISEIAQKLISNGSFETFGEVLEAVEDYLKDLGDSNYLPLARELAGIWTGIEGSGCVPLFLFVDKLRHVRETNKWLCAVEGNIDYDVGKILVAAESIGNLDRHGPKNRFALVLQNESGAVVERCELFRHHSHSTTLPSSTCNLFDNTDAIVAKASKGFVYKLEYMVPDGINANIDVEGLICKIFPESFKSSSCRMSDQDNHMGLFLGCVDSNGKMNGDGSIEYDDGKRFVGQFSKGLMTTGVLYRGSRPLFTMHRGKWSNRPALSEYTLNKYPQEVSIIEKDDARHRTSELRGPREEHWTRGTSSNADYQSSKYSHREGRDVSGTSENRGTRDSSQNIDYYSPNSRSDFSAPQPGHYTRPQDPRSNGAMRYENREIHAPPSNLRRGNGPPRVSPRSTTVPGFILRRGKNQDEYSEVTRSTWLNDNADNELNDTGSLESDDLNGEHELGIVLEGEQESRRDGPNLDEEKNIPIFFVVKTVKGEGTDDKWCCVMESSNLLDQVSKVMVAVNLEEDHKCSLALALYNERDVLVERCNLTDSLKHADNKTSYYRELTTEDDIVSKARLGSKYKLEYVLGDCGSRETVHAKDWICKIFPVGMDDVPSYKMKNLDGEIGTFMGEVDSRGKGFGLGVMEYNDGKRFVGTFKNGKMFEGVLYHGADNLCSMQKGTWDTENKNEELMRRYPQRAYILKSNNRVGIC